MTAMFGSDVFMSGSGGEMYFFADFDRLVPRRLTIMEGIKRGESGDLGCYFLFEINLK